MECYFDENKVNSITGYSCVLTDVNINVTKQTQKISISGYHEQGKSDEDVVNIKIVNSHTPFIVPEILEAFPKIQGLEIRKSGLQRIQSFVLSTAPNLKDLIVVENNIQVLEHGAFEGLEFLEHLLLVDNHIERVETGAFFGLNNLQTLRLTNNRFASLPSMIFGTLTSLNKLFITHSYLTRIDGQMFRNNTNLHQLILTDNKINEIESTFIDELGSLELLKLKDNICVDEDFVQHDEKRKIHKNDLVNSLDKCFDNFAFHVNGRDELVQRSSLESKTQKITLEFEGKLRIYGENGELLFSN